MRSIYPLFVVAGVLIGAGLARVSSDETGWIAAILIGSLIAVIASAVMAGEEPPQ